ncbi:MAG: inositol monophosphatase [Thermomicrobiales bacterium]|nr:inositol monophosphatase [Thermomicrobiales bacterium]
MAEPTLQEYVRQAEAIAREAGAILRARFGQPHDIRYKGILDMVTEADRESETLIAERIRHAFPDHDLVGEEGSRGQAEGAHWRWYIDPLDGTTNFAHGLPNFAVSLGLEDGEGPAVGVVYDPMRDELFAAARGGGATLNGRAIRVSQTPALIGSLLSTGFSYELERRAWQAATWFDLMQRVQSIRQMGAAALHLCYVAAGRLDGYWEYDISAWDVSAGAVIVTEAGGVVTRLAGDPFRSDGRQILASNGRIHEQFQAVVARHALEPEAPFVAKT